MRPTALSRWFVAASAFVALAAWPFMIHGRMAATADPDPVMGLPAAPVERDFLTRNESVAFLESRYRRDPADMITPARLSSEYLQRYRERGDIGDVMRAESAARTSLAILPGTRNPAGAAALAAADVTLHRFREARTLIGETRRAQGRTPATDMALASIDLELGEYDPARTLIDRNAGKLDPAAAVTAARWYEISGQVPRAQRLLDRAAHYADSIYSASAERRAWYHFRLGELRFLVGDNDGAVAQEHAALDEYPDDFLALGALARIELARKHYERARDAASAATALVPSPETLGILADAQTQLGEPAAAAAAQAEIAAVEKIGNAQRVNDRLIAVYLADHDLRPDDAYAIARRELAVRDDIYAEDTLAWCAAKAGHWAVAQRAIARALRFDTEDPRIQYHAGVIAQHAGDRAGAIHRFGRALALNAEFSATQADDARTRLAALR